MMRQREKMYKLSFRKNIVLVLITIILGAILCPSIFFSSAEKSALAVSHNNYCFTKYDVKVEVTDKNEYIVEENFTVRYGDPENGLHKGIVRGIPLHTRIDKNVDGKKFSLSYDLKHRDVSANELYDTYVKDNWLYIELGGDDYINYSQSEDRNYTVKYTLIFGDDFKNDYDFFFYNIIGTDYPVFIFDITFSLTLPKAFDTEPKFYTGSHGTTDPAKITYDTTTTSDGKVVITGSLDELFSYEGLTIDLTLEEGYFEGLKDVVAKRKAWDIVVVVLACVLSLGLIICAIVFNNKKNRPVESVEFYPPLDTSPVDAAYLLNGRTTAQDMMSLIVYWASKGIVRIELDAMKEPTRVIKLQNIPEQEPEYERNIFNEMFQYVDTFSLKVHNSSLASVVANSHADVKAHNDPRQSDRSHKMGFILMQIVGLFLIGAIIVEAIRVPIFMDYFVIEIFSVGLSIGLIIFVRQLILDIKHWYRHIFPIIMLLLFIVTFTYVGFFTTFSPIIVKIARYVPLLVYLLCNKIFFEYDSKIIDKVGKLMGFKKNIILVEEKILKELVDEDPEYFYHVLPYAYTLGIADDFIEKFENIAVYTNENFGGPVTHVYIVGLRSHAHNISPRSSSGGFGGSGGGGGGSGGGAGGGGSSGR